MWPWVFIVWGATLCFTLIVFASLFVGVLTDAIDFRHADTIWYVVGLASTAILYCRVIWCWWSVNWIWIQSDVLVVSAWQWYWVWCVSGETYNVILLNDASTSLGDIRLLTTDNIIVLLMGSTYKVLLTSGDVIHAFAVPALGVKTDCVPGRVTSVFLSVMWYGAVHGQCYELCGILHAFMPFVLYVV